MKSKDVGYLKYFAKECTEKIENREIAPETTKVDRDYFTMYAVLRTIAVIRLHKLIN